MFEERPVARELPPMITLDSEPVRTAPTRLYWLVAIPVVLCVILGAMVSQLRTQYVVLSQQTAVSASELASERSHSEHGRMIDAILHDSTTLHFAASPPNAQIQVLFHPAMRRAVVMATRIPRPDPSKVYQLWMMPISGAPAISAGTFLPDANGSVFLVSQQLTPDVQFAGFEITAEEQGGSPAPTGTPSYTGK